MTLKWFGTRQVNRSGRETTRLARDKNKGGWPGPRANVVPSDRGR